MSQVTTRPAADLDELDRFYREGGLVARASPHVHYDVAECPHPDCAFRMEWIDFKLELHGDPEGIYKPLVTSWWNGAGFVGRCPGCRNWVRFRTVGMEALDDVAASRYPALPDEWQTIAQIA